MCGGQTKDDDVLNNERPFILYYPPLSPPSEGIFDGGWWMDTNTKTKSNETQDTRYKLPHCAIQ
jgi:hypothetical protein